MHVARSHHAPGGRYANLRFAEVFFLEASWVQHSAARRLLYAIDNLTAIGPFVRHEGFLLKLKGLLQHGRTALPVVQRLFAAGQRFYVRWREAVTYEPLLSLGCQCK